MERFTSDSNLQRHIHFSGRLGVEELQVALAQASLLVVPSLGGEVFGLVVAESMARGLPVVASDLGAFAEVLGDAGLTFRAGDAVDLASKIGHLLDEPELASRMSNRAQQRARDFFSETRMIEAHLRIYRSVVGAAKN